MTLPTYLLYPRLVKSLLITLTWALLWFLLLLFCLGALQYWRVSPGTLSHRATPPVLFFFLSLSCPGLSSSCLGLPGCWGYRRMPQCLGDSDSSASYLQLQLWQNRASVPPSLGQSWGSPHHSLLPVQPGTDVLPGRGICLEQAGNRWHTNQ